MINLNIISLLIQCPNLVISGLINPNYTGTYAIKLKLY
jgi:hypothetical protein